VKLLQPKVWRPLELAALKWSAILVGMLAGAYLAAFVRHYAWAFALLALLLAIRPALRWFRPAEQASPPPRAP
jgi:hypothetical protein